MKKYLKSIIWLTICCFVVSFGLFFMIDSPMPLLAGLFIAVFVFELSFLYFFEKQKDRNRQNMLSFKNPKY